MSVVDVLFNAPADAIPVPFNVNASSVERLNPARFKAAPVLTVVPEAIVPKGEFVPLPAEPRVSVPALTIVAPV